MIPTTDRKFRGIPRYKTRGLENRRTVTAFPFKRVAQMLVIGNNSWSIIPSEIFFMDFFPSNLSARGDTERHCKNHRGAQNSLKMAASYQAH